MLYVAMSSLQGRPMAGAFRELRDLADGVQLTPGNHPTAGFAELVAPHPTRRHHGFSFTLRRQPVWDAALTCVTDVDSVHPPCHRTASFEQFVAAVERQPDLPLLETMYPGHRLGSGLEIEWAMDAGRGLAVDVSHLQIQRTAGVLHDRTWRRLQDYARIGEIHVSGTDGRRDLHGLVTPATFGLAWVRERLDDGVPVVLEAYLHRTPEAMRRAQIELVRGVQPIETSSRRIDGDERLR
ncbi:MAG: hypothetical protein AAF211_02120 [Myxococcota bacterium]